MDTTLSPTTIIGSIYEASYNPDYWLIALEQIALFTQSSSAALLYQDNELEKASGTYTYNIPTEHLIEYSNIEGGDPNFRIMSQEIPIGKAAAIDHLVPDRQKLEEIYGEQFTNFIKTADYYHTGGAILFMEEERSGGLGLQRKQHLGEWNKEDMEKLNLFIPHLQRALNIQREFTRLKIREQALRRGLDKLLMGLILFDKEINPIYINPIAESILNYHPAIKLKNNKIYAYEHSVTEKIHSALVSAISVNSDDSLSSTSLGLKHPDCTTILPVIISEVEGILHGFITDGSHAHAVMCFSDPERTYPIEGEKLSDVYGLTSAESQVAISVANGISPNEIAELNGISDSTVRSQLKAIYKKLSINSQAELVKILLTGPFEKY